MVPNNVLDTSLCVLLDPIADVRQGSVSCIGGTATGNDVSHKADPNGVQRRNGADRELSCKGASIYRDSDLVRLLYETV